MLAHGEWERLLMSSTLTCTLQVCRHSLAFVHVFSTQQVLTISPPLLRLCTGCEVYKPFLSREGLCSRNEAYLTGWHRGGGGGGAQGDTQGRTYLPRRDRYSSHCWQSDHQIRGQRG